MMNAEYAAGLTEKLPAAAFGFNVATKISRLLDVPFRGLGKLEYDIGQDDIRTVRPLRTDEIAKAFKAAVAAMDSYAENVARIAQNLDADPTLADDCNGEVAEAAEILRQSAYKFANAIIGVFPRNHKTPQEIMDCLRELEIPVRQQAKSYKPQIVTPDN